MGAIDGRARRATRMGPAMRPSSDALSGVEVGASPDQGNRGWSMKVETLCCHSLLLTSHFGKVRDSKRREDIRVYVIVLTAWTGLSRGANKRADDWKMSSGAGGRRPDLPIKCSRTDRTCTSRPSRARRRCITSGLVAPIAPYDIEMSSSTGAMGSVPPRSASEKRSIGDTQVFAGTQK